jgi:cation diffusion facilitator family transporter
MTDERDTESTGTVLLAGGANLAIAIAKLIGGLLSGSAAMLAEAAHSIADTFNQVLLLTALRRSRKPPDIRHPFGYGKERYFWSLLAAVGIFVLGAGYSIYQGVHEILHPVQLESVWVAYVVLAVAFVAEGVSWLRAIRQTRNEAREAGRSVLTHLRRSPDPTVKTVALEDTAALVGILLAAAGITIHMVTGQAAWDGIASVAIGVLLILVAYALGAENMSLLVGEAVPQETQQGIHREIDRAPGVDQVVRIMTMHLSPDEVLVAAHVDVDDDVLGGDIEQYADEIERRVRARFPEVRHLFIDPTTATRAHSGGAESTNDHDDREEFGRG